MTRRPTYASLLPVAMIKWLTTLLAALLYVSAATWIGQIHHHETAAKHSDQCAACAWQLNAVTDAPLTVACLQCPFVETPIQLPIAVSVSVRFVLTSASRAPPEASA